MPSGLNNNNIVLKVEFFSTHFMRGARTATRGRRSANVPTGFRRDLLGTRPPTKPRRDTDRSESRRIYVCATQKTNCFGRIYASCSTADTIKKSDCCTAVYESVDAGYWIARAVRRRVPYLRRISPQCDAIMAAAPSPICLRRSPTI